MKLAVPLILAAFAAGTASATPPTEKEQARLDRMLAGRVAGEPVSCIPRRVNDHVEAFGDDTLVYYSSFGASTIYRNDPVGGCNGAGREGIIVSTSPQNQICSGDIIRVVDRVSRFEIGGCGLGKFTPYKRAK